MDELRNLQQMASFASDKFNQYEGADFVLPQSFKDRVSSINSNTITYNQYSAIIETRGSQHGILNIYLPNQWFYIASYFTDFYNELQKYKRYALEAGISKDRLKDLNGQILSEQEEEGIRKLSISKQSQDYLRRFVTDYAWWGGAKTIDRGDFYVSPILNYARLVNASQSFVTDLCAFLADKPELVHDIITSEENTEEDTNSLGGLNTRQIIYYGAPGTGKSNRIDEQTNEDNRIRTTFHPDSDYSTFVGAYKPTMKKLPQYNSRNGNQMGEEEKITYSFVPQAFLKAYVKAWKRKCEGNEEPFYLVIEEINRGNCAQIFGDLFQLLDRDEEGKSKYAICPDDDIKRYLKEEAFSDCIGLDAGIKNGEKMILPSNLYIWATMNTSDQSLFPIDSAFKRRWDWEYVPIKDAGKKHVIEIGNKRYDWWDFVSKINLKIDSITGSEDKKLGYWFVKPAAGSTIITADQFVGKVLFYLWNDVYKDYADSERSIFKTKEGKAPFTSFFGDDKTERLQAFMEQNDILPIEGEINDNEIEEEIGKETPTSELRAWQQSFWTKAKSAYADAGLNVTFAPPQKNSYQLSIGITDMSLINWANKTSGECRVGIYIEKKHGDIYYPKLLAIKNVIEEEIGFEITWKHDQGRNATIFVKKNYNLSTDDDCKAAIAWLVEKGKRIYNVFRSHIDVLK